MEIDFTCHLTAFQSCANRVQQVIEIERLGQVIGSAHFYRLDRRSCVAVSGDHDHLRLTILPLHGRQHFQPGLVGQAQVEQHQIRVQVGHCLQPSFTSGGAVDLVAFLFESEGEGADKAGFVVNDQEGRHG